MAERVTIYRYTPQGESLGVLHYTEGTHTESLDGTDKLDAVAYDDVRRNERMVWQDELGKWHEHIVGNTKRVHSDGKPKTSFTTYNSIGETWCWTADGTLVSGTVGSILGYLLKDTKWSSDGSDIEGTFELETYHKQVRQCISELCEMCGGELVTDVHVISSGVTERRCAIIAESGNQSPQRQFTYGWNMTGVTREEDNTDRVYTAVYAYGKKLDGASGDYPERLTFADINGGDPFVLNEDALEWWGCMGNDGTMHHSCIAYTDDNCTDPYFLREQAEKMLANVSTPAVAYRMDLPRMDEGDEWLTVGLGDLVHVVDDELGMSFQKRVSSITRGLDGQKSGKVVIGKRPKLLIEKFKAQERAERTVSANTSRVSASRASLRTSGVTLGGGWTHQVDGVALSSGTINFVTGGTPPSAYEPIDADSGGWQQIDDDPSWSGSGGGGF